MPLAQPSCLILAPVSLNVRRHKEIIINWEAIGAIGEIIGAVGVIATLVYLSVQLRQNTKALRSSSWQAIQDSEQRFDELLSSDLNICDLWVRGTEGGLESLADEAEKVQFTVLAKQLIDQFQTHHYQYERGLIEGEIRSTWQAQFEDHVITWPGLREVLVQRRKFLRPSFVGFVDGYLRADDA